MGELKDLFSTEEPVSTDVDNAAFDNMIRASANQNDNFLSDEAIEARNQEQVKNLVEAVKFSNKSEKRKALHTAFMVSGLTPVVGNVADIADAALYISEGEFGEAAWSVSHMLPFIGQLTAASRKLKFAKEAGKEITTLYRGVADWYPGKMISSAEGVMVQGHYWRKADALTQDVAYNVGFGRPGQRGIALTGDFDVAKDYATRTDWADMAKDFGFKGSGKGPMVLEFNIPTADLKKIMTINQRSHGTSMYTDLFGHDMPAEMIKSVRKSILAGKTHEIGLEGIPFGFLTKVHKFPSAVNR